MTEKKGTAQGIRTIDQVKEFAPVGIGMTGGPQGGTPACPTFTLRADQPGHLRGLMAALAELPDGGMRDGLVTLREFELWEETHR